MGLWDEKQENYNEYRSAVDNDNQASLGHEVLSGGAAFAAMRAFENHQRKEGKTVNHAFAKELIAGFAGAEIDKLAETKGADWFDQERAKHDAKHQAQRMYDDHYGQNDEYDPNRHAPPRQMQQYNDGNW